MNSSSISCPTCGESVVDHKGECPNCGAVLPVTVVEQPKHQAIPKNAQHTSRVPSKHIKQAAVEGDFDSQLKTVSRSLDSGDFSNALRTYQAMRSLTMKLKHAKLLMDLLDLLEQSTGILIRQKEALAAASRVRSGAKRSHSLSAAGRLALIPVFVLAGVGVLGLFNRFVFEFVTEVPATQMVITEIMPIVEPTVTLAPTRLPDPVPIFTTNIDKIQDLFHWSAGQDVVSLSFSPDGQFIASGDSTGSIKVWRLGTEQLVFELHGTYAVFSPNGKWIGVAGSDGLALYDASDGSPVLSFDGSQPYSSVLFSPDSQLIVGGANSNKLYVWSVNESTRQKLISGFNGPVHSLSFSRDDVLLAAASNDTAYVWNLQEQEVECSVDLQKQSPAYNSIAMDMDGVWFATGQENGQIYIWRISNGERMAVFDDGSRFAHGLQFFHGSNFPDILVSGDEVKLSFWVMEGDGTRLYRSIYSPSPILSLDIAPENRIIATGGTDGVVHLWGVLP